MSGWVGVVCEIPPMSVGVDPVMEACMAWVEDAGIDEIEQALGWFSLDAILSAKMAGESYDGEEEAPKETHAAAREKVREFVRSAVNCVFGGSGSAAEDFAYEQVGDKHIVFTGMYEGHDEPTSYQYVRLLSWMDVATLCPVDTARRKHRVVGVSPSTSLLFAAGKAGVKPGDHAELVKDGWTVTSIKTHGDKMQFTYEK